MTRALATVDAGDPALLSAALRIALAADGPAVLPVAAPPIPRSDGAAPAPRLHSRSPDPRPHSRSPDPHSRSPDPRPHSPESRAPEPPATHPPERAPEVVPNRVAVVIETSGSSGPPKRVALSSDALLASAAASATALGGTGQWLLALPAHYIAGVNVLVRSIVADTEPVALPPGPFEPERFISAAATMDAPMRFTSLVPTQLARLLDAATDRAAAATLRRFDRILVGGQSIQPALISRAAELGLRVTRTYGSSETSGGCVYDGIPIGTAAVRIRDGQIEISGPMLAEAYLDDEIRTAARFVTDAGCRWYLTGDVGVLTAGVLQVTGRLDRVIISGGVKVSLDEVERVVRVLPGLADSVAVAASSTEWGEVPVIVASAPVRLESLRAMVAESLGRAAAPREVVILDRIPLLENGKPDRMALKRLVRRIGADEADN